MATPCLWLETPLIRQYGEYQKPIYFDMVINFDILWAEANVHQDMKVYAANRENLACTLSLG